MLSYLEAALTRWASSRVVLFAALTQAAPRSANAEKRVNRMAGGVGALY